MTGKTSHSIAPAPGEAPPGTAVHVTAPGPREHLAADQAQEFLRRIATGRLDAIQFRPGLVQATGPVGRRQARGGLQRGVQRRDQRRAIRHQFLQPFAQAAGA